MGFHFEMMEEGVMGSFTISSGRRKKAVRCPECGQIMRLVKPESGRYECTNPKCKVIEVKFSRYLWPLKIKREPTLAKKLPSLAR